MKKPYLCEDRGPTITTVNRTVIEEVITQKLHLCGCTHYQNDTKCLTHQDHQWLYLLVKNI